MSCANTASSTRSVQLKGALQILQKAEKSEIPPIIKSPFAEGAPAGQYALFFGPAKNKLRHVIHTEVSMEGKVKMFDPQNGQVVTMNDLLSLRIKWGDTADSPIVPVLIKGVD